MITVHSYDSKYRVWRYTALYLLAEDGGIQVVKPSQAVPGLLVAGTLPGAPQQSLGMVISSSTINSVFTVTALWPFSVPTFLEEFKKIAKSQGIVPVYAGHPISGEHSGSIPLPFPFPLGVLFSVSMETITTAKNTVRVSVSALKKIIRESLGEEETPSYSASFPSLGRQSSF